MRMFPVALRFHCCSHPSAFCLFVLYLFPLSRSHLRILSCLCTPTRSRMSSSSSV